MKNTLTTPKWKEFEYKQPESDKQQKLWDYQIKPNMAGYGDFGP